MTRGQAAGVVAVLIALCLSVFAGSSAGQLMSGWVKIGNATFTLGAEYRPERAPADRFVPIELTPSMRIDMKGRALPPRLDVIAVDLDEDFRFEREGLGTCQVARIETAPAKRARKRCRDALVGGGKLEVTVKLGTRRPLVTKGRISVFNGTDDLGRPAVVIHGFVPKPAATTYMAVAEIVQSPVPGHQDRLVLEMPEIAHGQGAVSAFRFKLRKRPSGSRFLTARCSDRRLSIEAVLDFHPEAGYPEGRDFEVSALGPCRVTRG